MTGFVIGEAVKMVLLPAAVVVTGGVLLGRGGSRSARAAGVACIALAYGIPHTVIAGWPGLPPGEALHWIPWLGIGGLIVLAERRRWLRVGGAVVLAAAVAMVLIFRLRGFYGWSPVETFLWLGATLGGLVLFWSPWWSDAVGREGASGPLALVAGGVAAVSILSHSVKLAELSAALGFALVALTTMTLLRLPGCAGPRAPFAPAGAAAGSILLAAILVYGQHYAEVPATETGLLALGGLAPLAAGWPPVDRQPVKRLIGIQMLVALVPTLVAVGLAWARYRSLAADPYAGY